MHQSLTRGYHATATSCRQKCSGNGASRSVIRSFANRTRTSLTLQSSTQNAPAPSADVNPEDIVGAAWDPHGLLPPITQLKGGHFARRERERAAKSQQQQQEAAANAVQGSAGLRDSAPIRGIGAMQLEAGGVNGSDTASYDYEFVKNNLQERYMMVDLGFPGLKILNYDPFVCIVDDFCSPEQCAAFLQNLEGTNLVTKAKLEAGNIGNAALNAINARRTSTTLLLDTQAEADHPDLAKFASQLQQNTWKLLCTEDGAGWGRTGKLPSPQQYCYESLQIAKYESGQYYLSHEDAFPLRQAAANAFQRHATLIVYLNDVAAGGATRFDHLDVVVQPKQGRALLFFPSLSDGTPDSRTLHTALEAKDTKWIAQQWIARGYAPAGSSSSSASGGKVQLQDLPEVVLSIGKNAQGKRKNKAKSKKRKGFGA